MQGLGFVFFSVCVKERLIWTARPFYHFFIFRKFKPQKILIFIEHLYQREIAVFQSTATCFSHFALWEKRCACLLKKGKQTGDSGDEAGNWKCSPGPVCGWFALQT